MDPSAVNGAAPSEPTSQAASAVAPPSSPDGSESAPSPASGGAAPLTVEELRAIPERERTPRQKRRLALLEKQAKAEAARARREAKKAAAAPAAPAPAASTPAPVVEDERDDSQRARETGGFWRLTLRVVSLLLWPFGYRLEALTAKEVDEDVQLLAPLTKRHRWLDVLVRYAALPYLLAERIAGKVKKREPAKP